MISFSLNTTENKRTLTKYGEIVETLDSIYAQSNITFSVTEDELSYDDLSCKIKTDTLSTQVIIIVNAFNWGKFSDKEQKQILFNSMVSCSESLNNRHKLSQQEIKEKRTKLRSILKS